MWTERLPRLKVSISRVRISPWYVARMCAEMGTSRADGADGGATSTVMAATAFLTAPVQEAETSPEAAPAMSTLFNGKLAVEIAAAICAICIRSNFTLAVPFAGGGFLTAGGGFQFGIWNSLCAVPPNARAVTRGTASFSGVMLKGKAASMPETRKEESSHSTPRVSAVPSTL